MQSKHIKIVRVLIIIAAAFLIVDALIAANTIIAYYHVHKYMDMRFNYSDGDDLEKLYDEIMRAKSYCTITAGSGSGTWIETGNSNAYSGSLSYSGSYYVNEPVSSHFHTGTISGATNISVDWNNCTTNGNFGHGSWSRYYPATFSYTGSLMCRYFA